MKRANVAERLLALVDWSSLHAANGTGEVVERGLRELLASDRDFGQ
jgi:hypothetical protein